MKSVLKADTHFSDVTSIQYFRTLLPRSNARLTAVELLDLYPCFCLIPPLRTQPGCNSYTPCSFYQRKAMIYLDLYPPLPIRLAKRDIPGVQVVELHRYGLLFLHNTDNYNGENGEIIMMMLICLPQLDPLLPLLCQRYGSPRTSACHQHSALAILIHFGAM